MTASCLLCWIERMFLSEPVLSALQNPLTGTVTAKEQQNNDGPDKRDQYITPGQRNPTTQGGWHLNPQYGKQEATQESPQ